MTAKIFQKNREADCVKRKWSTLLAGTLALMMVLMGTGYAYWTDTLHVTTKATTGELDVTFMDLGLYAQYKNETGRGQWSIIDGIQDANVHTTDGYVASDYFADNDHNAIGNGNIGLYKKSAEPYNSIDFSAKLVDATQIGKNINGYAKTDNGSDSIAITLDQMYPGYAQAFRSDIVNLGTMAARLSDIQFTTSAAGDKAVTDELRNMLGVAVYIDKETNGNTNAETFKLANAVGAENCFTMGGVDFVRLAALEDETVRAALTQAVEDGLLLAKPEGMYRMDLFYAIGMDPDAAGVYTTGTSADMRAARGVNDSNTENKGITITMNLLWNQFNKDVPTENQALTNILENQNA